MSPAPNRIRFFRSATEFRTWLSKNHDRAAELWLGFYKKSAGQRGITYAEALDEALCFGWIDGVRKTLDESSFVQRFTPRTARSIWSRVNVQHVSRLIAENRMAPPGLAAYEARTAAKMDRYSYEQSGGELPPALEEQFRAHRKAWTFFQAQPPGYQRTMKWWIISAKQDETRQRRLAQLIRDSASGARVGAMSGPSSKRKS